MVITNHFTREDGVLGAIERLTAPFADTLGWHSDFRVETVLQQPALRIVKQDDLPPLGMMTFLVLEKSGG